ncbi:hypothetical protein ACWIE7_05160, partial [Dietzia sp. NPDC055343]
MKLTTIHRHDIRGMCVRAVSTISLDDTSREISLKSLRDVVQTGRGAGPGNCQSVRPYFAPKLEMDSSFCSVEQSKPCPS